MRPFVGIVCVSAIAALVGCKKDEAANKVDKAATKTPDAAVAAPTPVPLPADAAVALTPTPTPTPTPGDTKKGNEKIMSAADEEEALGMVNALADEICRCVDRACGEAVMKQGEVKMKKWEGHTPGPEGEKKLGVIVTKMTACMQKLPPAATP